MSSSNEINRANASKSTGPKTAEGKRRSSRNALKHGIFAKDVFITGENSEEFLSHKTAMIRRLNPRDVLELHLVEQIVSDTWTIKRVRAAEQELYADAEHHEVSLESHLRSMVSGRAETYPTRKKYTARKSPGQLLAKLFNCEKLERLNGYQHRLTGSFHRCLKELRALRKDKDDPNEPLTDFSHSILCKLMTDDEDAIAQNEAISDANDGQNTTCDAAPNSQMNLLNDESSAEMSAERKSEPQIDPSSVPKAA